jgi:hypothetical protein
MGQTFVGDTVADTTLVTTAETVVATIAGVSVPRAGMQVELKGHLSITTGTATTGVTLRFRRDSLTGALVGEAEPDTIAAAVGSTEPYDYQVMDSPGEIQGATYVLTAQQVAATGNGTVIHANAQATVVG